MKKFDAFTKFMFVLVVLGLTFTSCSNEESLDETAQEQDALEVTKASEIDEATAAIGDLVIEAYEGQEANDTGKTAQRTTLPDCVTITVLIQQGFREVTIDFGSDGCRVRGHLVKGQIVLTYQRDPQAQEIMIGYHLVDFYFDAKNIIGGHSLLKQLSNDNGNPQFTHRLSFTVKWPNGAEASREGLKIREWVVGFGSGVWSDNVFEITGNWLTTFVNGNTHSYEVVLPLRREVICYYFVSGSVDVQRTNFGGIFDYGNGDCDNEATFTFNNGRVVDIILN